MGQLKRWAIWGGIALVVLCAVGLANRPKDQDATPTPLAAAQPTATPSPLIEATNTPANTETPPTPPATQTPNERYITIAKGSAMPNIRKSLGVADGEWDASVINVGEGPELQLRVPLNPATSNDQFVRLGKQNLAQIINALFVADPQLARIAAIGTFPDQAGESPAISVIVLRSASAEWGTVTADQMDGLAEKIDIKPEYR